MAVLIDYDTNTHEGVAYIATITGVDIPSQEFRISAALGPQASDVQRARGLLLRLGHTGHCTTISDALDVVDAILRAVADAQDAGIGRGE